MSLYLLSWGNMADPAASFALYVSYNSPSERAAATLTDALTCMSALQTPDNGVTTYAFYKGRTSTSLEFFEIYSCASAFWAHAADAGFGAAYARAFTPANTVSAVTYGFSIPSDPSDPVRSCCDKLLNAVYPRPLEGSFVGRVSTGDSTETIESDPTPVLLRIEVATSEDPSAGALILAVLSAADMCGAVNTAVGSQCADDKGRTVLFVQCANGAVVGGAIAAACAALEALDVTAEIQCYGPGGTAAAGALLSGGCKAASARELAAGFVRPG